jgi:hypothetical protein
MTDRSSEPTLILQSSDIRIVVHGSQFVAWRHPDGGHAQRECTPRFLASNALLTSLRHGTPDDFEVARRRSISIRIDWAASDRHLGTGDFAAMYRGSRLRRLLVEGTC